MGHMQLYGTPVSHFTRKVRLLLDHLERDYTLIDVGNVAASDAEVFSSNPLMNVPVLRDGATTLFDSDHIAAHLVRHYDPVDRFDVLTSDASTLNARAVLNGAMAAEVRIVLAERTGLETRNLPYFDKARAVVANALEWCEAEISVFQSAELTYLAFHLISFWDHVHHYDLVGGNWPKLTELAEEIGASGVVGRSAIPG